MTLQAATTPYPRQCVPPLPGDGIGLMSLDESREVFGLDNQAAVFEQLVSPFASPHH